MNIRDHSRERLRGIAFMIAAVFIFSIMDALMKRLSAHYGPWQVAYLRSVSSLICMTVAVGWRRSWRSLAAHAPLLHVLRGMLGVGMLVSFIYAVHRLTLAQTYSLFLAAPLLMTSLSVPILGDKVTLRRWLAISCGMAGVLVILQPWSKGAYPAIAAAAAGLATICYSLSALTVRSLGRSNSSMAMVFWYLGLVSVGSGVLAIDGWQPLQPADWVWLAAIGLSGALGQLWLTEAFRRAPPSVVGPFEYSSILWAFGIDWLFWSAVPSVTLIVGATIVIGSGIYIIVDERHLAAVQPSPAPP